MTIDDSPNVLFVVIDSLRARNVGTYGYHRNTTPFLDSLADESLVYESAWSPAVWTLPSHVSMLTGYEVREHGVQSPKDAIDPKEVVFHKLADEYGYETGIFSENTWLTEADMGISRSFETVSGKPSIMYPEALSPGIFAHGNEYGDYIGYIREALSSEQSVKSLINGLVSKLQYDIPSIGQQLVPESSGGYFINEFLEWEENRNDSWAACINLMEAHRPYIPDTKFDKWDDGTAREIQELLSDPVWDFLDEKEPTWKLRALEALYDGGIRQADSYINELVHHLKEKGVFENTLLIIAGDHGEAFGEFSHVQNDIAVEHKQGLHHVQTHVPLLVNPPYEEEGRVSKPISLTETARVIEEVVRGNRVKYDRERPVISVCDNVSSQLVSDKSGNGNDALEAVIERIEGKTVKHTRYQSKPDTTVSEIISNASSSRATKNIEQEISEAFAGLSPVSDLSSEASVNETAAERLEKLGYL